MQSGNEAGLSTYTLAHIDQHAAHQPVGFEVYPYAARSTILKADMFEKSKRILITWSKAIPETGGRDPHDIAAEMGVDIYEAAERLQPAGAIYFSMHEEDVQRIPSHPNAMIGPDGLPFDSHPHPRLWGTFPRVLGHIRARSRIVLAGTGGAPHDQLVGDAVRPDRPRHRRRGSFRQCCGFRPGQGDRHRDL